MNSLAQFSATRPAPALQHALLASLAGLLAHGSPEAAEFAQLRMDSRDAAGEFAAAVANPCPADERLLRGAVRLDLGLEDIAAISLGMICETELAAPQLLKLLQGREFGPWPSLGLARRVAERLEIAPEPGAAALQKVFTLGILTRIGERAPMAETTFCLSPAVCLALGSGGAETPGLTPMTSPHDSAAWRDGARALARPDMAQCLVFRHGDEADRRHFSAVAAQAFGRNAMLIGANPPPGTGAAAVFGGWLPVERIATRPGARAPIAHLPGYDGPRIVLADPEGGVDLGDADGADCRVPDLGADDRWALWQKALPGEALPGSLRNARFGPARIAAIGARAKCSTGRSETRLRAAMGAEMRAAMEPHAVLVAHDVGDAALCADDGLKRDLDLLLARCRWRSNPQPGGIPGVRALLSGPSGAGKTHACAWIATRLGLPLFKADLSSVVSKYIGETEENLSRLFAQAENADCVLLMDEADSLFGARTETKDSSDRFANNQTNYLLTRMESFDGIVLLTTNGRDRIDAAFSRRLDQVIEVPLPAARERRSIWRISLGEDHALSPGDINRLAALADLAGGHIRNIAQTARILSLESGKPAAMGDILTGVEQEYRKIGRTPPSGILAS